MSELIEINKDNCVLSKYELIFVNQSFVSFVENHGNIEPIWLKKHLTKLFLKINKLNEMAKELCTRNLSVESIIKFYEIGKQVQEKQK